MPVTLDAVRLAKAYLLYSEEVDRLGYHDEATEVMVDVLSSLIRLEGEDGVRYATRGQSTWDDYLKATLSGAGGGATMGLLGGPAAILPAATIGAVSGLGSQATGDAWHNQVNGPIAKSKALASDFAEITNQVAKILKQSGGEDPALALSEISQQVVGGVEEAFRPILEETSKKYGLDPDASFMQTLSRPLETIRRKMDLIRASAETPTTRSAARGRPVLPADSLANTPGQSQATQQALGAYFPPPTATPAAAPAVPTPPAAAVATEFEELVTGLMRDPRYRFSRQDAEFLVRRSFEQRGLPLPESPSANPAGPSPAPSPVPAAADTGEVIVEETTGTARVAPRAGLRARVGDFVERGLPGYMSPRQQAAAADAALGRINPRVLERMPEATQDLIKKRAIGKAKLSQFGKGSIAFVLGDWLTSKAYDAVRTNILGHVGVLNSYANDMEKIGAEISKNLRDPQYAEAGKQASQVIKKITQGLPAGGFLPPKEPDAVQPQQPTMTPA